jgi:acyl carrier protein
MSPVTADSVRALILEECADAMADFGMRPEDVADDLDLRQYGLIDSLGFLELVTGLEDALGIALDLGDVAPEELTVIGPLSRAVAAQAALQQGTTALRAQANP